MADNYLERKMEELRIGRTGALPTRQYAVKRNMLSFPLKTLRVLIVGDNRKHLWQYADEFRRHDGRVAIFNSRAESDTDLGYGCGCRYYDISDTNIEERFRELTKVWHDIDVVVILDVVPEMQRCLVNHLEAVPYPNDWGMPVLEIGAGRIIRHNSPDFHPLEHHVEDISDSAAVKQLIYLSLPQNRNVSEIVLQH